MAGSEEGAVKLFDIQSKNVLRVFTGHTAPVSFIVHHYSSIFIKSAGQIL